VDLVAGVAREANVICVRAFQAAVGCVNTNQGNVIWKQAASGGTGLAGDGKQVYGVESDGKLMAWQFGTGEIAWTSERLRYRQLGSPLLLGRSVVVGDSTGLLHFVARTDGSQLTRVSTDDSGIAAPPVIAGTTLVAVTRNGMVLGLRPE